MTRKGPRSVLIIEAPLINAQGLQTGWMSAVLDISEQRRVEELSRASHERLQATARLATVGEMASLLSHELNQPLAAIASYATGSINLLKGGPHAVADIELAMTRISEQAERAALPRVAEQHEAEREAPRPLAVERLPRGGGVEGVVAAPARQDRDESHGGRGDACAPAHVLRVTVRAPSLSAHRTPPPRGASTRWSRGRRRGRQRR